MPNEHHVELDAAGMRIAVVVSRFNEPVTTRLLAGAVDCLTQHGVADGDVDVYHVAGAFEVPQLAAKIARAGRADGVVCLGALIRGETDHYDVLASAVGNATESIGVQDGVPVAFGILTCETGEQAMERAGGKHGNLGWNAALSLIEMVGHWRALK